MNKQVSILLPVNDRAANIDFFQSLGYVRIADCEAEQSFSVLTDGKIHLILDEGYFGGKGILYYQDNINKALNTLKSRGYSFAIQNHPNQDSLQASFTDPNGTKIILSNHPIFKKLPTPSNTSSLKIGRLLELTITTQQMDKSLNYWKKLGFSCVFYRSWDEDTYGSRAILSDGNINIGIHQTAQIEGMKLTYFDKEMQNHILEVKKMGIPTTFEMIAIRKKVFAAVGIQSPNGTELYLFKRRNYLDLIHFPDYSQKRIRA
ncbi:MAG: hypothetical protein ACPG49_13965 [Chitinophagales bacterium]